MQAKRWAGALLGVLALVVAGCGAAAPQGSAGGAVAQAPVMVEAATPVVVEGAAAPSNADPVEAASDWTQVVTMEGDYFVLGNPVAPVRLVDFSNFF